MKDNGWGGRTGAGGAGGGGCGAVVKPLPNDRLSFDGGGNGSIPIVLTVCRLPIARPYID
jgi:hypothetical protein